MSKANCGIAEQALLSWEHATVRARSYDGPLEEIEVNSPKAPLRKPDRPETTAVVARQLVTRALGVRLSGESREKNEREQARLKEVKGISFRYLHAPNF